MAERRWRTKLGWGFSQWVCLGLATTLAADTPDIEFAIVPASDIQAGGPVHDFRVSRFEIHNEAFVAFLNDAISNLDNGRGAYLYFEAESGRVSIHTNEIGAIGTGGGGALLFDATVNERIRWVGGVYRLDDADLGFHPVTGVTWFGAVKFCNWLTLAMGISPDERAYSEGPSEIDWHPITIAAGNWASRDLDATEREALLGLTGLRLPMDGGIDGADLYSEWFKFATASSAGAVTFDAPYGYGRSNPPGGVDANFDGSGDPFEPFDVATTPVGFFNGINRLADGTATLDTANGYVLYDLSGNVWEWMQDQLPGQPDFRSNRGGSWQSAATALAVGVGGGRSASAATPTTGFRVVQSVARPLLVTPHTGISVTGVWGGPYAKGESGPLTYRVANQTNDAVAFFVTTPSWVAVSPGEAASPPGLSVEGGDTLEVTLALNPSCDAALPVGTSEASARFQLPAGADVIAERPIEVFVEEPLSVSEATLDAEMVFGGLPAPAGIVYELANGSQRGVSYSVRVEDTSDNPTESAWVRLTTGDTGTIAAGETNTAAVEIDAAVTATLPPGFYTADIVVTDACTGAEFVRRVTLAIHEPFTVSPEENFVSTGLFGGPFDPPSHALTLLNPNDVSVHWAVEFLFQPDEGSDCTPPTLIWLSASSVEGVLKPTSGVDVELAITADAGQLGVCTHSLVARFVDVTTGFSVDRVVTLDVTSLRVEPTGDAEFRGPLAGPFVPATAEFTVHNVGLPELSWSATVDFEAVDESSPAVWLEAVPPAGVILDPDGSETIVLQLTDVASSLASGTYRATVTLIPNDEAAAAARRTAALTVGGEAFSVEMVNIPPDEEQIPGPDYFYRCGRHEVTNAQYARFLNDAWKNRTTARAAYLYFETPTGSVLLNDTAEARAGDTPPSTTRLYDAAVGKIFFDAGLADSFLVESGLGSHPVVGVSWYGAVKFCNWATLVQGMAESEQVYNEGPTPDDWTSVAIDPTDPASLHTGFRLPMDDRASTASARNEWYKVASRGPDDSQANPQIGFIYGFGRDVLGAPDANYLQSGDGFDNAATPVGYFDGGHLLADGVTSTRANQNGYGVFDLTGNVAEWVHHRDGSNGAVRGGHFNTPVDFPELRTDLRAVVPAASAQTTIGFRLAQSLSPVGLTVAPTPEPLRAGGPAGGSFDHDSFRLSIRNGADYAVDGLGVSISSDWLVVDGVVPALVPPNTAIELPLRLSENARSLGLSPSAGPDFVLVPWRDAQANGPAYDFWIARTEVTNAQFVAFLNDARANVANPRGAFVYFDLDSADVYVNDREEGAEGTAAPSAALSTLLYDAQVGRIRFLDNSFVVESGFESHPVVGVSWYGAVKYCNWLTLASGLPAGVRAYTEGPSPEDWHPISITAADWTVRNLTSAERQRLVEGAIGFRLPMDDESAVPSAFNEWNKFASARTDDDGVAHFDAVYGFGRITLDGVDANYADSGDTLENATTEAGFFNGINTLSEPETNTAATDNRYGLFDLTGNVAEWMQDFADAGDLSLRAVRGGSYLNEATSADLTVSGRSFAAAGSAGAAIGFRVARGTGHIATVTVTDNITGQMETRHVILDVYEPTTVDPAGPLRASITYCESLAGRSMDYTISSESASPMNWRADVDAGWVTLAEPVADELTGILDVDAPSVTIKASMGESADALPPGEHMAIIRFVNETTGIFRQREVLATVRQPIEVTPDPANPALPYTPRWGDDYASLPPVRFTLRLSEDVPPDCPLAYIIGSPTSWITVVPVGPAEALTGDLPAPPGELAFDVGINESADALPVGPHTATVGFAFTDPGNPVVPAAIEETITLDIRDLVDVAPPETTWNICCGLDAAALPANVYTLTNAHDETSISIAVSTDVPWIDLDATQLTLQPGDSRNVSASLSAAAIQPHGTYRATIFFENLLTGFTHERSVVLEIRETLSVTPLAGFELAGRVRADDAPVLSSALTTYQLENTAPVGDVHWRITRNKPWVLIDGGASASGVLRAGATNIVAISVDPQEVEMLDTGETEQTFTATVVFADQTDPLSPAEKTRTVSLRLIRPQFAADEASVPASVVEPDGPEYSFWMGRFAVTNFEFVAFLNDAMQRPGDPRGEYMYFDTDTGDVYINTSRIGGTGGGSGGRANRIFSPAIGAQVLFTGSGYEVVKSPADFSQHPVTGVSWYGAVKYCNWLTLDQGMTPRERCYTESPESELDGWHPVSIARQDFTSRDLNDRERRVFTATCRGYRLPMDDGFTNDGLTDAADAYNEWFKAAAWNQALSRHTTYAFGRDVLTIADANFNLSGDSFESLEPATTPVGFYDGEIKGALATRPNENTFGIFDLTGNIYVWMQGRFSPSVTLNRRTVRGGSWADPVTAESLRSDLRQVFAPPLLLSDQIGLRVVRSPGYATGDGDGDGDTDIVDYGSLPACHGGPGALRHADCESLDFDGDVDVDLRDVAAFFQAYTGS